jgi:hypothetical protein
MRKSNETRQAARPALFDDTIYFQFSRFSGPIFSETKAGHLTK